IKFYQRQRASLGRPVSDGWCAHTFREKFGEWPDGLSSFPMEISPEVSNYIKHKLIRFAKGRQRTQRTIEKLQATIPLSQERGERSEMPIDTEAWRIMQAKQQLQKNINSLSQQDENSSCSERPLA
ncbi:hypothetical protein ACFMEG_005162, partial [Escherichia coli]